jgi:predicted metal-dependent peptidase
MNLDKEITRTIGKFILKRPVIGAVSLRMKYEKKSIPLTTPGIFKPFAVNPATNTVVYDPDQIDLLLKHGHKFDIEFLLAHEAMHILTGSLLRKGDRDIELWNMATDFEINYLLKDMGFEIPQSVLYSKEFHTNYYYAEKIYDLLQQEAGERADNMKGIGQGEETGQESSEDDQNNDEGQGDADQDEDKSQGGGYGKYLPDYQKKQLDHHEYPKTQQEMVQAKTNTQNALSTASQIEREMQKIHGVGTLPSSIQRMIDRLMTPQITWKDLLNTVATTFTKNNYSYRRCNPYYRMQNIYVPTLRSPESKVVVIVDTSGSIGEDELRLFISEVVPIMEMFNTTFITCDAEVYVDDIVENAMGVEDILNHIKGGGGTVFAPAFKWVEENMMDSCTLILMTDGYNDDKEIDLPFVVEKTIVLTTGEKPSGFKPDVLINVDLHPDESW